MSAKPAPQQKLAEKLRSTALALPDTTEGIACAGTSLEKRTIKVSKKAFLFLGTADAMLKLDASLPEAEQLAAEEPERYQVGAHGWIKVVLGGGKGPPASRMVKWVKESYQLFAPAKKKT